MATSLEEDSEIRNLRLGSILKVRVFSRGVIWDCFYLERRKINTPATGESEYEHLVLLEEPKGKRTFANTFDARYLKLDGDCVVEKVPFEDLDFGRTHYIEEYPADNVALELAKSAFSR